MGRDMYGASGIWVIEISIHAPRMGRDPAVSCP